MDGISVTLVVFFEDPFYVGVLERVEAGRLCACRTVFGAEPKDVDVLTFILRECDHLKLSPAVEAETRMRAVSPKRAKRDADRRLAREGIGTRSQQALAAGREAMKTERRTQSREQREAQKERLFELKQQKRKEKRRGR